MDRPTPMRRPEREPVTSWMPASAWREHCEHAYPLVQPGVAARGRERAGAHAVHGPRAVGGRRVPARRAAARRKGRLLGPGPGAGAPGAARGGGDRADRGAPPRRGSPQPQGRRPPRARRRRRPAAGPCPAAQGGAPRGGLLGRRRAARPPVWPRVAGCSPASRRPTTTPGGQGRSTPTTSPS